MKRAVKEARERIEAVACTTIGNTPRTLTLRPNDLRRAVDGLDAAEAAEKRLRKQVADLKARLKAVAAAPFGQVIYTQEQSDAWDLAERAIDLKLKSWRKGGK